MMVNAHNSNNQEGLEISIQFHLDTISNEKKNAIMELSNEIVPIP